MAVFGRVMLVVDDMRGGCMILVIGAMASGKETYARSLGYDPEELAIDVHERVRTADDVPRCAQELAGKAVVTCAEVGAGVVPLAPEERAWRDAAGRLMRELAFRADAVVRMTCGIPVVVKDDAGLGDALVNPSCIELVIVRHGQTPGNGARRYVGARDEPLSEAGRRQAQEAPHHPEVARVYVSPLRRTHETAAIMFPNAEQVVVEGVQEMDFGDFSGRSADEMEDDAQYRAWVDGNCEGRCPNGEDRGEFTDRVCEAVERLLREAAARGERRVYLVAHGGTMMASLWSFSAEQRGYYEWHVPNCSGYRIRADLSGPHPVFYPDSLE